MPDGEQDAPEPRVIELAAAVELELQSLCAQYPRARQVYDGLNWQLARNPGIGHLAQWHDDEFVAGADVRIVKTTRSQHVPRVTLVYRAEPGAIKILAIRVEPAGYNPVM